MPETVRADARRNRERIVAAASACFAAEGIECQMSAIARTAGVGTATVFRHFPAKRDLAVAVLEQRMQETEELIAREAENPDAVGALRRVLEHFVESMVNDRGLKQAAAGADFGNDPDVLARRDAVFAQLQGLIDRAKTAGGLRDDVELLDLVVLAQGVAHAAGPLEATGPGGWRRFLAIAMRGVMTEEDAEPLPPASVGIADAIGH